MSARKKSSGRCSCSSSKSRVVGSLGRSCWSTRFAARAKQEGFDRDGHGASVISSRRTYKLKKNYHHYCVHNIKLSDIFFEKSNIGNVKLVYGKLSREKLSIETMAGAGLNRSCTALALTLAETMAARAAPT